MNMVIASNNAGKIRELHALVKHDNIKLIPQAELGIKNIEENGLSFIENAIIKARHASRLANMPALADDSGLVVSALQGNPGIYSARYAGENASSTDNINKLLTEMKDIPVEKRRACFHCALVFLSHYLDPVPLVCEGTWQGLILTAPSGKQGFGYDPVFYDPVRKKSAAQLPLKVKNSISHRGIALKCLLKKLPEKI